VVSWRKPGIAVIGVGVGALATVILMVALKPALRTRGARRELVPIDQASSWRHDAGGVTISGLSISANHTGLAPTAPGASVTITNNSDEGQMVGAYVVLGDADYQQIGCCWLLAGKTGAVMPGGKVTPVVGLAMTARDIRRVRFVGIDVTQARVP
jgi:hypothetical protein